MQITIGQRILAAVIAHQLDISTDRALKLYVRGRELDPSWDEVGEALLKNERASCSRTSNRAERVRLTPGSREPVTAGDRGNKPSG
jgi:hypothetical protein